jgi:hypothetical protein
MRHCVDRFDATVAIVVRLLQSGTMRILQRGFDE